ncbi:hypothetical protein LARI1_G003087 [Lachnellula arida]|uniref:Uncharacterized protein n=1 Tax=Lachnellula arida TaxID=1316785 RepID=A0A8T9BPP3_9HELO|nr:hypothetical protein LARI1_G003087 [Lachnellula arida]
MAKVGGGRYEGSPIQDRCSVPFFFEPGLNYVVAIFESDEAVYGEHVLGKLKGFVESQDMAPNVSMAASEIQVGAS